MPEDTVKGKYGPKEWTAVPVQAGGLNFLYAFQTSIEGATASKFGHVTDVADSEAAPIIVGAKYPRPPRANGLNTAGNYVSSYIDKAKISGLKKDGFTIQLAKGVYIYGASKRSLAVSVPAGKINYAWRMPTTTANLLGDEKLGTLKISKLTTDTEGSKTVVTPNFPRPATFKVKIGQSTVGSFCGPDGTIAEDNVYSLFRRTAGNIIW